MSTVGILPNGSFGADPISAPYFSETPVCAIAFSITGRNEQQNSAHQTFSHAEHNTPGPSFAHAAFSEGLSCRQSPHAYFLECRYASRRPHNRWLCRPGVLRGVDCRASER